MEQLEMINYESTFEVVRQWSPAQRFNLVQDILKTLAPQEETARPKRQTIKEVFAFEFKFVLLHKEVIQIITTCPLVN